MTSEFLFIEENVISGLEVMPTRRFRRWWLEFSILVEVFSTSWIRSFENESLTGRSTIFLRCEESFSNPWDIFPLSAGKKRDCHLCLVFYHFTLKIFCIFEINCLKKPNSDRLFVNFFFIKLQNNKYF